jgi:hypothetical protein
MLVPKSKNTVELIESLEKHNFPITKACNSNSDVQVRYIQSLLETRSTILIVDKKVSLVMELRDDTRENFHEAIGYRPIPTVRQACCPTYQYLKTCGNKPNYSNN